MDSTLNTMRNNIDELEIRFEKLREDIVSQLNECSDYIKSAKMLCHQAAEMATVSENESANASIENTEWNDITVESATALVPRKVILDVEGEKFHTSVETLTRTENTFFHRTFLSAMRA
ncbi:unnamed protein product [Rotaria sp. Silwood2]|nr:unnamed protein product [Rotaria sp. Silwood2]CAF4274361.1 unnamed protein product [Rotaria sp. Silwood2]